VKPLRYGDGGGGGGGGGGSKESHDGAIPRNTPGYHPKP